MTREPVVSGIFYEGDADKLKKQIEKMFLSPFGPGSLPSGKSGRKVLGAIAPHAGFQYSGMGAAHVYKGIAEANNTEHIDTFIVLAPSHTAMGVTSLVTENYKTPFGEVEVDKEIANELMKNCPKLREDVSAHINEHSLEVQIPFLQYISDEFKIVPIMVCSPFECLEVAEGIKKVIETSDKNICVIASSDFTHYGPNYDYFPYSGDEATVKRMIQEQDSEAIGKILDKDLNGFLEEVQENGMTICGYLPIGILIRAIGEKSSEIKMLKYYMSSDVIPDKENSVSYASIVFYG